MSNFRALRTDLLKLIQFLTVSPCFQRTLRKCYDCLHFIFTVTLFCNFVYTSSKMCVPHPTVNFGLTPLTNTRHVCILLNAFPMVKPNMFMGFRNFEKCYTFCQICYLSSALACRVERVNSHQHLIS